MNLNQSELGTTFLPFPKSLDLHKKTMRLTSNTSPKKIFKKLNILEKKKTLLYTNHMTKITSHNNLKTKPSRLQISETKLVILELASTPHKPN